MIDTRRTPDHSQRAPRAGPITHPIQSGRCSCNPCLWLIAAHRAAVAGVVEHFDRILSTIVRANRNVWLLQSPANYLLQSNHTEIVGPVCDGGRTAPMPVLAVGRTALVMLSNTVCHVLYLLSE